MEEEADREAKKQKIRMDVAAFQQYQMQTQEDIRKKAEVENTAEGEKVLMIVVTLIIIVVTIIISFFAVVQAAIIH